MSKSVLIVEGSNHYHILDDLCQMYKNKNFDITLALNVSEDKLMINDLFRDFSKYPVVDLKNRNFFFFNLFFQHKKYDLIHISTGAENTYLKFIFNIICFYFYCFFKKEIVLQIRNTRYFLFSKNWKKFIKIQLNRNVSIYSILITSFSNLLRYLSLMFADKCIFESNTQLVYFNKFTNNKFKHKSFFLYSKNSAKLIKTENKSNKYSIGIPGSYDNQRRDYRSLLDACLKLNEKQCKKLRLVFIGNFSNVDQNFIDSLIEKNIEVLYFKKFVDTYLYEDLVKKCDFFLSIHKHDKKPFIFAGSGIIGEITSTDKKIILKKKHDPLGEFSKRAIYYHNLPELLEKISNQENIEQLKSIIKKFNLNEKYLDENLNYLKALNNF